MVSARTLDGLKDDHRNSNTNLPELATSFRHHHYADQDMYAETADDLPCLPFGRDNWPDSVPADDTGSAAPHDPAASGYSTI